ncbi:HAMP domain-containing protein [Rhizobacter sp. AJA081-3]|uniref:ATP-binding protein n=1 Tax=Rhizobacter sp. AJA081-3 TaxID=2753607 RepID=UPI001ADF842C|nr:ATP-binding protein [Rhizobacter sp. AJA081-3]QTN23086.1 HAMP domain-containing protein [Rhizobacter sp. AJA081-3]
MGRTRPPTGLAQQYVRWLAALFITLELVTAAAALGFIFLPMARRAADDLAGLMVLSAQTWNELPPETRPAFEQELERSHQLALRPDMPPPQDTGLHHGPYLLFLERAFERRTGHAVFFLDETAADGRLWLWTTVPAGGRSIGVGFAADRMKTQPLGALALPFGVGIVLVALLSWWLARRIAQPVAQLELAAAQLARGASPELLAETGPRELAGLARHFNRMALQVRELLDARTTLFAGVSHDLRTPLARMRLAIEMLTLRPDPALLQRLEHDIEEMNALIGQMLEIARGMNTETAEDFELCGWLRERERVHEEAARSAGAQLTLRCDLSIRVHAAPGALARVVDNLLGNALRYAPGPIELVARVVPSADQGGDVGQVYIGVLDRGPSIPEDQLALVFRPFHRGQGQADAAPGAFGLGLAIVQQLARANGWQVGVTPRAGGGLEAWVVVPAA